MRKLFFMRSIIIGLILQSINYSTLWCQQVKVLTYEEAINIALRASYTVKSYSEKKKAMQEYFRFYQAQFKPRLDYSAFLPSWNESVIDVQQANDLPVYNSFGSMQVGSDVKFTYTLPTGGNLALSSTLYRENLRTVLALQNFRELTTQQAYSSLSLSFNQPIFTKNELKENVEEAQFLYERTSNQFTRTQIDIIYEVTRGFYEVYRATREVEIAREKLENSEEAYRIAQLKSDAGRIPAGDVLIAEIAVSQNRANLLEGEGSFERICDNFKQLIGMDLEENIQIIANLAYDTISVNLEKAIEEALRNRREIEENRLDVELQKIKLDRAKRVQEFSGNISVYYDLTGVSTLGTGSTSALFESSFRNFVDRPPNRGIMLTFSYPIFDWGRGNAKEQQETATLRDSELNLENVKTTIVREVRDIVRSVKEAKLRLDIFKKSEEVSQRSYEISRMRFENGDITSQELGIEQERLAETQLAYLNAFNTYQLAIADLKRKTLWDFESNTSYLNSYYLERDE